MLVFENQRRSLIPLTNWSSDNMATMDRSPLSDESGTKTFPYDALRAADPPEGYIWSDDWAIDRTYTQQDKDGFSYGVNFEYIMANFRKGRSTTQSHARVTRRRKWVRHAKRAPEITGRKGLERLSTLNMNDFRRHEEYLKNPNRLLGLSQERDENTYDISIPWSQVLSVDIITPSVLSVTVNIHRYFGTSSSGNHSKTPSLGSTESCFRDATVELFLTNCPSTELYWLILERREFYQAREDIKQLINEGIMTAVKTQTTATTTEEDLDQDSETKQVDTVELSLGSETIQALDSQAFLLEKRFESTYQRWRRDVHGGFDFRLTECPEIMEWSVSSDFRPKMSQIKTVDSGNATEAALRRAARRSSRYRVYIGTLLSLGLEGSHDFEEETIDAMMRKDFALAQRIGVEGSTDYGEDKEAFDRINFLLDVAETRIRDSILCGWSKIGGPLEHCIGTMVNGYYIEIIALLSKFFENKGLEAVKGVERKKQLISFFLMKDDRLCDMLVSALRPFRLSVEPKPFLSRLLKIDGLINFYNSILLSEMTEYVDRVLRYYKDNSKETSKGLYF